MTHTGTDPQFNPYWKTFTLRAEKAETMKIPLMLMEQYESLSHQVATAAKACNNFNVDNG